MADYDVNWQVDKDSQVHIKTVSVSNSSNEILFEMQTKDHITWYLHRAVARNIP